MDAFEMALVSQDTFINGQEKWPNKGIVWLVGLQLGRPTPHPLELLCHRTLKSERRE